MIGSVRAVASGTIAAFTVGSSLVSVAGCSLRDRESDTVGARAAAAATGARSGSPAPVKRFRSRPDLRPPGVRVTRRTGGRADGYVFIAPKNGLGQTGPMLVDDRGELVWFRPLRGQVAMNFRVQHYRGRPVLSWWQGTPVKGWGRGELLLADSSYRVIARVRAKGEYKADHHDSLLTPDGTALLFIYRPVRKDLSGLGGPRGATVMDSTIQEIDVETGRLVWRWSSLRHVGIRESYKALPDDAADFWDYFHINSVQIADDGNLIIGARNTHAVYKIDRKTGAVIWRLGGKRSDFSVPANARFAWQHDAQFHSPTTLTIFDNAAEPKTREQSRGITLGVNAKRRRVWLKRQYEHPQSLLAPSQANMQVLPNGNVFIGWGRAPYASEFSQSGRLLFDLRQLGGTNSYRAYRFPWKGEPADRPAIWAQRSGAGRTIVYASWNGATELARWRLVAGPAADELRALSEHRRQGFETMMPTRTAERFVAVEALDASGTVLGRSRPIERG